MADCKPLFASNICNLAVVGSTFIFQLLFDDIVTKNCADTGI